MDWSQAWQIADTLERGEDVADEDIEFVEPEPKARRKRSRSSSDFDLDSEPPFECPICGCNDQPQDDSSGMRLCCPQCGLIAETIGDTRPDFGARQDGALSSEPVRTETINPLMPHASMNTEITYSGRLVYPQYQMIKLNRWSSLSPLERSLYVVFNKIESACARNHVPTSVVHSAKWLFKRVYECNMEKQRQGQKREGLRGVKRDGLIGACVYMGFKVNDLYWTKTRVAQIFDIDISEIRRGLSIFSDLVKEHDLPETMAKITGCKQYIHWFSVGLGLPRGVATMCCKLYKALSKRGIGSSKQPQSTAAGCLWAICQALRPDIEIEGLVNVTGISRATIKDVMKMMGGAEKICLIRIFADDLCQTCEVTNSLTCNKIQRVAKVLFDICDRRFRLYDLAAFAIYFVLTANGALTDEVKFVRQCEIKYEILLSIAKKIIPYRDAILSDCLDRFQARCG